MIVPPTEERDVWAPFFSDPTRVLICPQTRRPVGVFFGVQRQHVQIKEAPERIDVQAFLSCCSLTPPSSSRLRSAPPRLICLSGGEWHRGFFFCFFLMDAEHTLLRVTGMC